MKAVSTQRKTPVKAVVKENSFPIVAIGASAGGLEAMMELLKYLPATTGMAYIYVQHLSPDYKSMLTEILSKKTKMKVQEIDDMDKIEPNHVFVIPHNKGIEVTDGHIKLIPRSERNVVISIDILFSSLAEAQKERVIGIILSGSASDGTMGMKAVKQEGGLTFAQDDTAKFTSMPHSAIAAGVVDFILPPKEIALELARLSKHPLIKVISVKNREEDLIENSNPDLKIILNQLYKATNVDFSAYKMNTIKRRIIRRMLLYKITKLKEYAKLLAQKKEEIDILYQDLLINVTSFFRDTETHKYLKENLFPKLLKRKKSGESMRIWIPACATGEEAYSIAMMFLEIQESKTTNTPVQIFATDLSEQAISKARIGTYTKLDLGTLSPKRIQRFFTRSNGGFRINKAVREMCVFAPHNLLHDPPFSRLDFISCCNLFIYLDNPAQKKAMNTFHYALNDDGFLMLGKSENITQSGNLFKGFNKKYKIFSRKTNSGTRIMPALSPRHSKHNIPLTSRSKTNQNITFNSNALSNAIDAVLLSEFMPVGVVINHQMEILQFRGTTDLFLTHPQGNATLNILKLARPEIAFELRNAISKVIKTKHHLRKSGIELKINSTVKIVSLEIVPLKIESDGPLLLILFTEQVPTVPMYIGTRQAEAGKNTSHAKDRRIKKLEQEIAAAHADALALAQEQEAFTEELQSANEEIVSSNEELQTVNEELETSKEETESANEELTITNQELQTRNDQLNESYDYSEAIIATMPSPMVVLDKSLRVKSASKTFYKKFKVNEEETEGVLLYDLGNRQWNIPRLRELLQEILPKNSHFHDFEISHTFPFVGEKIMLLNASRIVHKTSHEELILLAFTDVTEVRKLALEKEVTKKKVLQKELETEKRLKEISEEKQLQLQNIFNLSPFTLTLMEGKNFVYKYVNEKAAEVLGAPVNEIIGKSLFEILPEIKAQVFKEKLTEVLKTGKPFVGKEVPATYKVGDKLVHAYFDFVYEPFYDITGKTTGVVSSAIDVTEKVLARKKIEESEVKYRSLFNSIDAGFCIIEVLFNKNEMPYDYRFLEANNAFEKQTGLIDAVGKTMKEMVHGHEQYWFDIYGRIAKTGKSERFENEAKALGIYYEVYAFPVGEPEENRVGMLFNDITERKQAEEKLKESETRFRAMADSSPVLIWTIDANGLSSYYNKTFLDFIGVSKDEDISDWEKIVHPDDIQSTFNTINKSIAERCSYSLECRLLRADGNWRWVLAQGNPRMGANNEFLGFVGSSVDITERKQAEEKISLRSDEFEKAVKERTKELAEQKDFSETIVNTTVELIAVYDTEMRIINFNKACQDFFKMKKEDIVGKVYADVFPSLKGGQGHKDLQRALNGEKIHNPLYHSQVSGRYYENFITPLKNEAGEVYAAVAIARDITDNINAIEKIKQSEEKFSKLFESSPFGITLAEASTGKIIDVNENYAKLTGYTREEIIGHTSLELKVIEKEAREIILEQVANHGSVNNAEVEIRTKSGKIIPVLVSVETITIGEQKYFLNAINDISERKKSESELEQKSRELEKMNKELESFAYVSSHDLKEPLRKLKMFVSCLIDEEKETLSVPGKHYLERAYYTADRMQSLIDDLLFYSSIKRSEMKFEITDLNFILNQVKDDLKEAMQETGAVIDAQNLSGINGISFQLRQLFNNLIGNALKFSREGVNPRIIIKCETAKGKKFNDNLLKDHQEKLLSNDPYCHISISDNGIGFDPEYNERTFEVFQRLHSHQQYKGTGIGLAICKKIVENHNGIITAAGKINEGATFDIYLPLH